MEEAKGIDIYVIVLKFANNQPVQMQHLNDIKLIGEYLSKKCLDSCLIFVDTLESIELASALNDSCRFMQLRVFGKGEDLAWDGYGNEFVTAKENQVSYTQANSENFLESLYLYADNSNKVLILDEYWHSLIQHHCENTRDYQTMSISILQQGKEETFYPAEEEIQIEIESEEFYSHLYTILNTKLKEQLVSYRTEHSQNILYLLKNIEQRSIEIQDSVEKILINKATSAYQSKALTSSDIELVKTEVKILDKFVLDVETSVKYIDDMKKTYEEIKNLKDEESKLLINKFIWNEELKKWRIRIENSTTRDFHNVSVYWVEKSQEICSFTLIEANCYVWKEIEMGYSEEIFGNHLIALSQNQIAMNEPFMVYYCKLACYEDIHAEPNIEETRLLIRCNLVLKNYSKKVFNSIMLSIPGFAQPLIFYDNLPEDPANVLTQWSIEVNVDFNIKLEDLSYLEKNFKVFAFSGDEKISNEFWISLE